LKDAFIAPLVYGFAGPKTHDEDIFKKSK